MNSSVTVGIPTNGNIRVEIYFAMLEWNREKVINSFVPNFDKPLSYARNQIVKTFLSTRGATHLLFIDSDMGASAEDLNKLLGHNEDIVGGLYYGLDHGEKIPIAWDDNKIPVEKDAGCHRVAGTGCGFLLIKRHVFNQIPYPWFDGETEDIYFCDKAKGNGFEVFVDFDTHIPHFHLTAI